jgi:hypothetical protein
MLRGEPVLKFVERLDGRENGGGDFNGFRFHGGNLSWFAGNGKGFLFDGSFISPVFEVLVASAQRAGRDDPAGRCPA